MADEYYLKRNEKVNGPFSIKQLRTLANEKKLKRTDQVSQHKSQGWVSIEDFLDQQRSSPPQSKGNDNNKTIKLHRCGFVSLLL